MINVGAKIPNLTVTLSDGAVDLGSIGRPLVIFFFPKANSPVCTAENCGFRDAYPSLSNSNALILGVSRDSAATQAEFMTKYRIPYQMVSDRNGAIAKAFDAAVLKGLLPFTQRATYVADSEGVVKLAYRNDLNAGEHSKRAMATLAAIALTKT